MSRNQPWSVPVPDASDPGRCTGSTEGYAEIPRCAACGHLGTVHTIPAKSKQRKACTTADPEKCPCKTYVAEVSRGADV